MKNPVQEAIDVLGGRLEDLAVVCRVSAAGVWRWLQSRKIHNAQHAVMAAEACAKAGHPEITVARLAGLEDEQKPPKGRTGRRGGPLSGTKGDEQADATGLPMEAA